MGKKPVKKHFNPKSISPCEREMASLAHDLGNPIHTILNISQALAEDSTLRSEQRYFDYLVRNAIRCQELMGVMQNNLRRNCAKVKTQ